MTETYFALAELMERFGCIAENLEYASIRQKLFSLPNYLTQQYGSLATSPSESC